MELMIEPYAFVGSGQRPGKVMAELQKGFEPVKLTVAEVKRRMDRGERFAFVDARRPEECTSMDATLPGATRMMVTEVDKRLGNSTGPNHYYLLRVSQRRIEHASGSGAYAARLSPCPSADWRN